MYLLRSNSMDSNQRIDINAELSSEAIRKLFFMLIVLLSLDVMQPDNALNAVKRINRDRCAS
jgi:hypothetical protein